MKQKAIAFVLAALTLLCMALSMRAANSVAQCYRGIGLRYAIPLTAQQVAAARQRAQQAQTQTQQAQTQQAQTQTQTQQAESANEAFSAVKKNGTENGSAAKRIDGADSTTLYPTFWCETQETLCAAYTSVQATAIGCLGDYSAVWPATFLAGGWPGQWQENACAVSDALAQALWGSNDIVGQAVRWGKTEYTVCGVFRSSRAVWVYSAAQGAGFTAVELTALSGKSERQTALEYVQYSGLGTPDSILYGGTMSTLAKGTALLPLWISAAALLVLVLKKFRGQKQGVVWLAVGFTFALALPQLLRQLPVWMLPPQWSDFAFWGRLWQAGRARIEEWLALAPKTKDVIGKQALLATAGWTAAAVLGEALCLSMGVSGDILSKRACQKKGRVV